MGCKDLVSERMRSPGNRVSVPHGESAAMVVVKRLCFFQPLPLLLTFLTLAHSLVLKSGIAPAAGTSPSSPPE